jgi:protein-disulfide isomerase-like protein with CxxC motif
LAIKFGKRALPEDDSVTDEMLRQELQKKIDDRKRGYVVNNDKTVKELTSKLFPGQNENEDIQVLDRGMQTSDTKCPYTGSTFVRPFKK